MSESIGNVLSLQPGAVGDDANLPRRLFLKQVGAFGLASGLAWASGSTGAMAQAAPTSMRIDIEQEPTTLDPLTVQDDMVTDYLGESVVEALTSVGSQQGGVQPILAESWEAQGTNWVFHIRKGVKFHNGADLTSADVIASYKRAMDKGSQIGASRLSSKMDIEATDDYTVVWKMPTIDPTVPARAAAIFIVPKEFAPVADQRLRDQLPGTGPYILTAWNKTQNLELKANANYWSGKVPPIQNIEMRFNAETSVRLSAIQAGETQGAMRMPPELAAAAKGFQVISGATPQMMTLRLNSLKGPFKDQRLREAVNLAIDRNLLIKKIYSGHAHPAHGQICTPAVFGWSKKVDDSPYDPDKARQLLKDANAVGVKIDYIVQADTDNLAAEAIVAMLNAVGFNINLRVLVRSEFHAIHFAPRAPNSPDVSQASGSNEMFDLTRQYQWLTCNGAVSTMCFPELDDLLNKAASITDTTQRQALYDQFWLEFQKLAPYAEILSQDTISFLDKRIQWTPRQSGVVCFQEWSFSA